jgi:hypothetical protein
VAGEAIGRADDSTANLDRAFGRSGAVDPPRIGTA